MATKQRFTISSDGQGTDSAFLRLCGTTQYDINTHALRKALFGCAKFDRRADCPQHVFKHGSCEVRFMNALLSHDLRPLVIWHLVMCLSFSPFSAFANRPQAGHTARSATDQEAASYAVASGSPDGFLAHLLVTATSLTLQQSAASPGTVLDVNDLKKIFSSMSPDQQLNWINKLNMMLAELRIKQAEAIYQMNQINSEQRNGLAYYRINVASAASAVLGLATMVALSFALYPVKKIPYSAPSPSGTNKWSNLFKGMQWTGVFLALTAIAGVIAYYNKEDYNLTEEEFQKAQELVRGFGQVISVAETLLKVIQPI